MCRGGIAVTSDVEAVDLEVLLAVDGDGFGEVIDVGEVQMRSAEFDLVGQATSFVAPYIVQYANIDGSNLPPFFKGRV